LEAILQSGMLAPGVSTEVLDRPEGGKMFGVLVVKTPDGRLGALRAFSGQLGGAWELPGWVPPLFDASAREQVEPMSDVRVKALTAQMEALAASDALREAREALALFDERWAERRAHLKALH